MWNSIRLLVIAAVLAVPVFSYAQDDTAQPVTIPLNDVVLDTTDVNTLYAFAGQAGQVVQVRLIRVTESYSPVFTIRRDQAAFGVWYTLEGNSAIAQITLPENGTYEIEVLNDDTDPAEFVLAVQVEGGEMATGSPVEMADLPCQYVVEPGDNMFRIAQNLGVDLDAMVAANPQIDNYRRIFPGNVLSVPGCTE